MKYFWTHKDNIPEGLGYGQFTWKHILWLIVTALGVAAFILCYIPADPHTKEVMCKAISAALLIIDVIKMILIGFSDVKTSEYLPLELCSFAAYFITADAFFHVGPPVREMLLTLFLPAALMALLFPTTSTLPAFNFYTIHQFVYHGLIAAYIFALFFAREIPLAYRRIWGSILRIIILASVIYAIDTVFDKNFMFLRDTYGNPMLEAIRKKTGDGIAYTGGLVCFCIVMIHVFFVLFKLIQMFFLH